MTTDADLIAALGLQPCKRYDDARRGCATHPDDGGMWVQGDLWCLHMMNALLGARAALRVMADDIRALHRRVDFTGMRLRGLIPSYGRGRTRPPVTVTAECDCGWRRTTQDVANLNSVIATHRRTQHTGIDQ